MKPVGQPDISWRDALQTRLRNTRQRLQSLNAVVPPAFRVQNVNDLFQEELTTGDRVAIRVARRIGSWGFIIGQMVFLSMWAVLNTVAWVKKWDPYPFMMMGLVLSIQAAFTAPLIMMAQNRESAKDRLMLQEDFDTNRRAEEELQRILHMLELHGHLLEMLLEERLRKPEQEAREASEADGSAPSRPQTSTTTGE
jgi:uncharacterized membrane protein